MIPNGVESRIAKGEQEFNFFLTGTRGAALAQFNESFGHFFKHIKELGTCLKAKSGRDLTCAYVLLFNYFNFKY